MLTDERFWFVMGCLFGFVICVWVIPARHKKVIGSVATTLAALLAIVMAISRTAG